jgi:hypothetical protein
MQLEMMGEASRGGWMRVMGTDTMRKISGTSACETKSIEVVVNRELLILMRSASGVEMLAITDLSVPIHHYCPTKGHMAPNCTYKHTRGLKLCAYGMPRQFFYSLHVPIEEEDMAKSPITAVMTILEGKGSVAKGYHIIAIPNQLSLGLASEESSSK